jgi:hypothetical protein
MKLLRPLVLAIMYAAVMYGTGLFMSVAFAQGVDPTPTPVPPGGHSLPNDLGDLVKATGFFGVLTWGGSALVFKLWKLRFNDINNDWKVIVSVAIGIVVAGLGYLVGGWLHYWAFSADGLYETLWRAGQAVLGAKVFFGASTLVARLTGARPGN